MKAKEGHIGSKYTDMYVLDNAQSRASIPPVWGRLFLLYFSNKETLFLLQLRRLSKIVSE